MIIDGGDSEPTIAPRHTRRYFQPRLSLSISQSVLRHVYFGTMMRAKIAASTDPKEKKIVSAVTRYFLLFGNCSNKSVPSVGIEPWTSCEFPVLEHVLETRTPTALPNKKRTRQRDQNEVVIVAISPNREVNNKVPLNAVLRPSRSEPR